MAPAKELLSVVKSYIESMEVPAPLGIAKYTIDAFYSSNPKYETHIFDLDARQAAFMTTPDGIAGWITFGVRAALEKVSSDLLQDGASAVFVGKHLKVFSVEQHDEHFCRVALGIPLRAVGKKSNPDASESVSTYSKLPIKLIEPIVTRKRWIGKHKSPTLWYDPKAGDYGYFESVKQEMFFDGISWIPVADFLDMHNARQAKKAFEIEATQEKIGGSLVYKGSVDALVDLPTTGVVGEMYTVIENSNIYVWTGINWTALEGASDAEKQTALDIEASIAKSAQAVASTSPPPLPPLLKKPKKKIEAPADDIFPRKRVIKRKKSDATKGNEDDTTSD